MVVDCGGGTVDITVHELESKQGNIVELYKATGGPYGSVGECGWFQLAVWINRRTFSLELLMCKEPPCPVKLFRHPKAML